MSLPALSAIRGAYPAAELVVLARPWVADIYALQTSIDRVIPYHAARGSRDLGAKWDLAKQLRKENFDCAILLQNAFEAALLARLAGIPKRIGYDRDGRGWLLTDPVVVPAPHEIPPHQRFYYLELLRRAGIIDALPESTAIRLDGIDQAINRVESHFATLRAALPVIGVSPGAAYGGAKRWVAGGFCQTPHSTARGHSSTVRPFSSPAERAVGHPIPPS